jgi:hypothetical protein
MKRLLALLSLFASTALAADPIYRTMSMAPDNDATVHIGGKLEPILFEPAAVRVTVHLESGTSKASHAWRADWVRDVHFVITDQGTIRPREVRPELLRQEDEQIRVDQYLVQHAVTAEFRLPPLQHGRYSLTVSYDGVSQSTPQPMIVVRGDETAEIRDWSLRRQLEKAKSWEQAKRLLFARTENLPHNPAPWFELAGGGEKHEDYETTKTYYEKAIALTIENGREGAQETVRRTRRVLELLPAYFADRQHLVIVRENLMGPGAPTIELRERKSLAPRTPEKN